MGKMVNLHNYMVTGHVLLTCFLVDSRGNKETDNTTAFKQDNKIQNLFFSLPQVRKKTKYNLQIRS
ncbi:hypothetical protein Hanom_Chr04g00332721 [Helianthus anomalus]